MENWSIGVVRLVRICFRAWRIGFARFRRGAALQVCNVYRYLVGGSRERLLGIQ
jgi:hypothetical protein